MPMAVPGCIGQPVEQWGRGLTVFVVVAGIVTDIVCPGGGLGKNGFRLCPGFLAPTGVVRVATQEQRQPFTATGIELLPGEAGDDAMSGRVPSQRRMQGAEREQQAKHKKWPGNQSFHAAALSPDYPDWHPCDNRDMRPSKHSSARAPAAALPPVDSLAFAFLEAGRVMVAIFHGQSLANGLIGGVVAEVRPAVQDMVYGSLRQFGRGDALLARLLDRPVSAPEIRALLLLALYRLETWPEAEFTVVDQAVVAAGQYLDGRCKGLVNAVLRQYLRRKEELLADIQRDVEARTQHPAWWVEKLQAAYPEQWEAILAAGNQPPPMALRVNRRQTTVPAALADLAAAGVMGSAEDDLANNLPDCIRLAYPVPVERLPGFATGAVSVQDPGAQRAAALLAPTPGSRVLDACSAPGGKTAHLLEMTDLRLLALDLKANRCRRVEENLQRLGLQAGAAGQPEVRVADCSRPATWWDGEPFDAILADVPCTASGVVRRHPDAKFLRRTSDVASFAETQARLLQALWPLLRPGGRLLYATCSVFPEENQQQMARFLAATPDATQVTEEAWLPCEWHDGFYYCLLTRSGACTAQSD